jgi:hypothetical protein
MKVARFFGLKALVAATLLLVWGFGALEARAGFVPLPTTLDQLTLAGNFTTVLGPNETETFSQFAYSASPVASTPTAANITVAAFNAGPDAGLTFSGAFFAAANTTVDYKIQYVVTAPVGFVINDALLSATFNTFAGSTGTASIGETLTPLGGGSVIVLPTLTAPNGGGIPISFAGSNSFLVQKDILLIGGSGGIGVSVINQGFSSSSSTPEPASVVMMGMGLVGVIGVVRFRRKAVTA